jgi:hypothetical protein
MINKQSFYDYTNAYVKPAINDAYIKHMSLVEQVCKLAANEQEVSDSRNNISNSPKCYTEFQI